MIRVLAPAKLTTSLRVAGVRSDGLHELEAEMVTLSLADELEISEGGHGLAVKAAPGTRVTALPDPQDNLVSRALRLVERRASVRLHKRIPLGGGLGGGSADAAAIFRWAGCRDLDLALQLGSDVPFCVVGGRALVSGAGEVVQPLPHVPRTFLLLVPPFGVDTGSVYRAWDDAPSSEGPNELASAATTVEPRLSAWADAFAELTGATPTLAGSGSTWFVEGGPAEAGTSEMPALQLGHERGLLLRARAVPPNWEGDD